MADVSAEQAAFSARGPPAGRWGLVVLFAGIVAGSAILVEGADLAPLGFLAVVPGLVLLLAPIRVKVGADGIATRWLGWPAFIPFSEIRDTRLEGSTIVLALHAGAQVRIRAADGRTAVAFLVRVEAWRRSRLSASRSRVLHELLGRGERSDADWRAHLQSIAVGGYREVAVATDELWHFLADANTEDSARLAAALVLRPSLDAAGLQHISTFAQGVLDDETREALERIASELPADR